MMKLGFVDVGGGTRGIYGAGVFDYFMEERITGDYFIGVSAGAANGASFIAGQHGRNLVFYNEYAFRKEYMSVRNFIKQGSYLSLDYIYSTLSESDGEYPLDYQKIKKSRMEFEIVATNARTGKPKYFNKKDLSQDHYEPIKASSCVPVLCKAYFINDIPYFDGGISDPIPFRRAFAEGCDKVVVILTKPKNFLRDRKSDYKFSRILKFKYPNAARALKRRADTYNESLIKLIELEKKGKAIIIAPQSIGNLKTLTQDHGQLEKLYEMGREDAKKHLREIKNILDSHKGEV